MSTLAPPIEFSDAENKKFATLASRMRNRAVLMLAAAGLQGLAAVLLLVKLGPSTETITGLVGQVIGAIIPTFVAMWSFDAARSFTTIVETQGRDRENLMVALDNLRRIVKLEYLIIAIVFGVALGGMVLSVCGFAAMKALR